MPKKNIKDIFIYKNESIKEAFKKLDKTGYKALLVVDKNGNLLGTVTDGDIRRYILSGKSLESDIKKVYNRKPHYLKRNNFSMDLVKTMLIEEQIELLPIVDGKNKVVDFITWNQTFSNSKIPMRLKNKIDIPVVIMAGGKGTRLDPFNRIFPKPLIPVGEKAITEIIIDEFKKQGIREYYLTLNYKGEMVKSYFDNIDKDYEISYTWEENFLGTAGSLKLLQKKISDIFIVSNCDVIVKANLEEVLELHKRQGALLTILSSMQHHKIPYGVIRFKKGGKITELLEKPEYTFAVNSGVYILDKESLKFIPKKKHFDMTDLIKTLIEKNKRVITYPVNESDYIDIGQWEEYKKAIEKLQLL